MQPVQVVNIVLLYMIVEELEIIRIMQRDWWQISTKYDNNNNNQVVENIM